MAGPAPGPAQGRGEAAAGGVREGAARGLVEGVRRQVAAAGRGVDGPAVLQVRDLGGGQGARPDVELVVGAREDGVGGEVGTAEPVVGEGAQGRRAEGHRRVAGHGGAVDVQRPGAVRDRDREMAPLVQRQRGGAVDALLAARPVGREGEARHAGGVAGGQIQVPGVVVPEVEDPRPVGVVGGFHPGGQGDRGGASEDGGGEVDVLVGPADVLGGGTELPAHAQYGGILAQRRAHLGQRPDHGADLVDEHLLARAGIRLRQHGQEVPGVVPAQVAVRLTVQPLPAAGRDRAARGEPGVGAEDLQQPVDVVTAGVVEHQLPLVGEEPGPESHVVEGEGLDGPAGGGGGHGLRLLNGGRGPAGCRVADRGGRRGEGGGLEEGSSGEGRCHQCLQLGGGSQCSVLRTTCEKSTRR